MVDHDRTVHTHYEQTFKRAQALEEMVKTLSTEARRVLRESGMWQQGFDGNEIVAVLAIYEATRKVLASKELAIHRALEFIGTLENDEQHGAAVRQALEDINLTLVGETVDQSIERQQSGGSPIIIQ